MDKDDTNNMSIDEVDYKLATIIRREVVKSQHGTIGELVEALTAQMILFIAQEQEKADVEARIDELEQIKEVYKVISVTKEYFETEDEKVWFDEPLEKEIRRRIGRRYYENINLLLCTILWCKGWKKEEK